MKERVVYTLSRSVSWIAPLFQSSGVKTEMTPHNNNTTAATHGFHCIRKCATDGMEREESRVETFSQGMLFYFSTNNKRTAAAKTQLLYRPHWWPKYQSNPRFLLPYFNSYLWTACVSRNDFYLK